MTDTNLQGLIIDIEARTTKLERGLKRADDRQRRAALRMEQRAAQSARQIESSYARMGEGIARRFDGLGKLTIAGLGGTLVAQQVRRITALADEFTRMENAMKVAGLSGRELDVVYNQLFQSAQRNSAPIQSLVDLYSKLALTQNELGVSNEELIQFTDGIAVALRVAGTDATTASGSLLQLSQALGGGIVRAEEFNSILEGTPTIAQSVARGMKEAGGSVAELRKLVVDGRVSSTAFFRAFEAGSEEMRRQAESSASTVGQAWTRLSNSMISLVGEFEKSTGFSGKIAGEIDRFSEDLQGLVRDFEMVAGAITSAKQAGSDWLDGIGAGLDELLGRTEDGMVINPDVREAEKKIDLLECEVETLQDRIELNSELGFDNSEALARLREVRDELAALRAEASNLPRHLPYQMDTGTFLNLDDYEAPTPAAVSAPISLNDHPVSGAGGSGSRKSGGAGGSRSRKEQLDDFQREVQFVKERTQLMQVEAASLAMVAANADRYGDSLEFALRRAELLHAAQKAGRQITPELTAEIDKLAQAYATAGDEAEQAAQKMREIEQQTEKGEDALADMFGSIIDGSKSAKEAVADLLMEIAKTQMLNGLMALMPPGLTSFVGKGLTRTFSDGGYTGPGGKYEPAGVVHKGEYVFSKAAVNALGLEHLDSLHRAAQRGYSSGGYVGSERATRAITEPHRAATAAPSISINAPVTVKEHCGACRIRSGKGWPGSQL